MRAVSFLGNRQAVVVDRPDPVPGPGQVIVKMVRAAVCGSDLHGYRHAPGDRGPNPERVPGHEPVGIVAQLGPGVEGLSEGQRVMVYHRVGCGQCLQCRMSNTNICSGTPRGKGWEGSDAEFVRCYAEYLYPLPDEMSWDTAVVISCQAGTAYAPLRRVGASGRTAIVVSGLGPVGLCATVIARAMGATVFGVDPMKERRDLATKFGAAMVFDPTSSDDPAQVVAKETGGGADALIETSGNATAQAKAIDYLRVEGMWVAIGLGNQNPSLNPMSMFRKQATMLASNLYPEWQVPEIFRFVQLQKPPLAQIITHTLPLSEAPAAFQLADTATTGKVVFKFD